MRRSGAAGMAFVPALARPADIALDFRGQMPAGVRFRRRSSALLAGQDGRLHRVEADVPRFERGGLHTGLLIEGTAINHLSHSSRPDLGGWSRGANMSGSWVADVEAPDGSQGAFRISRAAPAAGSFFDAVAGAAPWSEYGAASVWLRSAAKTGKWRLRLRDFSTYNGVSTVVEVGPSWRRYVLAFAWQDRDRGARRFSVLDNEAVRPRKTSPVYALNRVNPYERADTPPSLDSVLMWGAQYEAGNDASSCIPTQGGPAARAADEVVLPSSAVDPSEGTLTLMLPAGGRRGGVILDSAGDRGGLRLEYSNSGWITARIGATELSGFSDVTGDRIVRIEWSRNGAQIMTGDRMTSLVRRASHRGRIGNPLKLGDGIRLGMTEDGERGLGRVVSGLTIGRTSGAPAPVELPVLAPPSYVPSFRDDFDDDDLGRINENATGGRRGAPAWRSRYRHARKDVINKEKQIYMDPQFAGTAGVALGVQPFSIRDGVLVIRADRADPLRVSPHIWNHRYTSGCISSELTHWQTYGYFEIRARVPRGRGFWPAFWLLPKRGDWPPEIDVMEASGARPHGVHHGVIEQKRAAPALGGLWIDQFIDTTDGFHRYAIDWTPENIVFYVDGTRTFEYGAHGIHEDMYMLANLALGSGDPGWIPDPDDGTPFPGLMEIDYVHAYRRA
ncbi:MAG: glycoside hydrolase family 16 protein [Burkholderiales bacterium]|nr:glycoside hydrolase family 16 protein [Burkholderiales bacterium]